MARRAPAGSQKKNLGRWCLFIYREHTRLHEIDNDRICVGLGSIQPTMTLYTYYRSPRQLRVQRLTLPLNHNLSKLRL
jgi:hypothetical protein